MKSDNYNKRNSSLELLKLIAMLLIVINHVTRSIQPASFYPDNGYSIVLSSAPQNIQVFFLDLFCYFGPIGNAIFLISSIWFLLDSNSVKKEKLKRMIIDTWVISVVLCALFNILGPHITPRVFVLQSLFPIIFSNNWFVTCYLILYLIHPLLNKAMNGLSQKTFFKLIIGLFIAYFIIAFISESLLYYSNLIFFISSYFLIGYMKKYSVRFTEDSKINKYVFLVSGAVCALLLLITWLGGKHISALNNKMLMWTSNNNPFTFFLAFSVFNIFRRKDWNSKFVNQLSSLTLLIYIIHENIYVKCVLRPYLWDKIHSCFGYSHLIFVDLLYSIILFVTVCLVSWGYKYFNKVISYKFIGPVFDRAFNFLNKIADKTAGKEVEENG